MRKNLQFPEGEKCFLPDLFELNGPCDDKLVGFFPLNVKMMFACRWLEGNLHVVFGRRSQLQLFD